MVDGVCTVHMVWDGLFVLPQFMSFVICAHSLELWSCVGALPRQEIIRLNPCFLLFFGSRTLCVCHDRGSPITLFVISFAEAFAPDSGCLDGHQCSRVDRQPLDWTGPFLIVILTPFINGELSHCLAARPNLSETWKHYSLCLRCHDVLAFGNSIFISFIARHALLSLYLLELWTQ